MSDHLILQDGRAWQASSSLFSELLLALAESESSICAELGEWLRSRSDMPSGLIGFDMRGFDDSHQAMLADAIHHLFESKSSLISESSDDVKQTLMKLVSMVDAVERQQPPNEMNDFRDVVEFDGETFDIKPSA